MINCLCHTFESKCYYFFFTHNCASPQVPEIIAHSKLASCWAALPAEALDTHAKSQSGYEPNAVTPQPRCASPINRYVSAGRGCSEASPDVCLPHCLQMADGLDRD